MGLRRTKGIAMLLSAPEKINDRLGYAPTESRGMHSCEACCAPITGRWIDVRPGNPVGLATQGTSATPFQPCLHLRA